MLVLVLWSGEEEAEEENKDMGRTEEEEEDKEGGSEQYAYTDDECIGFPVDCLGW